MMYENISFIIISIYSYKYYKMSIIYSHKVIFLGDSCVGKTTIFDKLLYDRNIDGYSPTIGVDYGVRIYPINDFTKIKLKFWDTAGQERFQSIISSYYNSCNIVIFIYDAKRHETFNNIEKWIAEYFKHCKHSTNQIVNYSINKSSTDKTSTDKLLTNNKIYLQNELLVDQLIADQLIADQLTNNKLFFLIENKSDLITESNAIPQYKIDKLIKKYNMHYFKMSATSHKLSSIGVENVFDQIVKIIYTNYSDIYTKYKYLKTPNNNNVDLSCCKIL